MPAADGCHKGGLASLLRIRDAKHRILGIKGQNVMMAPFLVGRPFSLCTIHQLYRLDSCGNSSNRSSCLVLCCLRLTVITILWASHVCNSETRPSQENIFNLLTWNFSEVSTILSLVVSQPSLVLIFHLQVSLSPSLQWRTSAFLFRHQSIPSLRCDRSMLVITVTRAYSLRIR